MNTLKTSEKENVAISTKDEAEPPPLSMEQLDGETDYEDEVFMTPNEEIEQLQSELENNDVIIENLEFELETYKKLSADFEKDEKSLKLEINRLKKALKDKENKLPKGEQQENTVTNEIRKQPLYMNKQEAIHPKGILNNGIKEIKSNWKKALSV